MTQKSAKGKSPGKSSGALRKYVGESKKKTVHSKSRKTVGAKARANYISAVETQMASRVPSDQRGRLSVVKPVAALLQQKKKKNMKKPLTRGRKRKTAKKE